MSVRKLSSFFNNMSTTDNNNTNKIVPEIQPINTKPQKANKKYNGVNPSSNRELPPEENKKLTGQTKEQYTQDIKSSQNVSKFKNIFESQISNENNVIHNIFLSNSSAIASIRSGVAKDSNFKAILSQKLLNSTSPTSKQFDSNTSKQYDPVDTIAPPLPSRNRSNSPRSPLTPNINSPKTPVKPTKETTPALPPRNRSITTPLPTVDNETTPDYPVFSPQSILHKEINSFTFQTVNELKDSTDDLRKEMNKNDQVDYSNNIEVAGKINNIIYGRQSFKFRHSEDNFSKNAVRLTILSLQSNETFDEDFDSDDDWDDSPEPIIDYSRSFSADVSMGSIPLEKMLKNSCTQNLKWSQIMEKLHINIAHFNKKERNLQDAKYELISSEWSFFKALNILYGQYVEKLFIVLSKNEENKLFAYVKEVKDCSEKLLKNIERTWKNNSFTDNFCEIIYEILENNFDVYVKYCANQVYSEALLGDIVSDKSRAFKDILNDIQCKPECNGLHLHAYQLVPIRKINSFPNLLENILSCLTAEDREYQLCNTAVYIAKQLVQQCNSESKEAKANLRTKTVLEKLEFPKNCPLKLDPSGDVHMRRFIKSDNMEIMEMSSTLFGKRMSKKSVYVFLFNDIFVVARKSNGNKFMVQDYCFRINLDIDLNPIVLNFTFGITDWSTILYTHIKENKDFKPIVMILSCKTKTDALRWIEALDPPDSAKSEENFNFDFIRKVIVQRNYFAVHSDEINLRIGERYTIIRETEDGWSFGRREKDGECGWFQTENVLLVDDVRKRMADIKQRYQTNRHKH